MKIYYDSLAQEYAQHRQVHPAVLRCLIQRGELHAASQVLDVGCGTGNYTVALQQARGCSCWGVDPSEQMVAKAKARGIKARFTVGNAEQLAYPAGCFDLVFSVDVIHHLSDPSVYLREAYRVLKQGGQICTVTDSEEMIRHRQPLSTYFPETVELELERYPRVSNLKATMVQVGFAGSNEEEVAFAISLTDIQPYRDKAFSCLHLIPFEVFERGMEQMERDLQAGPLPAVSRYLLLWGTK